MKGPAIATLAVLAVAGLGFGASEVLVPSKATTAVENAANDRLRAPGDPYNLLGGTTRCTYLNGYGALITVELELVAASDINPFRPAYSAQEIEALHDRKVKKLPVLKDTLRALMVSSADTLTSLPPNERVAVEARLWHFRWEDSKGIPDRIFMSAEKSKLLTAKANPAALAVVVEEQDQ